MRFNVYKTLALASTFVGLLAAPVAACDLYQAGAPELASSCPKHPPLHIPNWGLQANLRARVSAKMLAWEDPATWVNTGDGTPANRVPKATDLVLVPTGANVRIGNTLAQAKVLAISGCVSFARIQNTVLAAGTVLVNYDGTLDMGVPARPGQTADPIMASARLRLATAILPRWYDGSAPTFEQYSQPYDPSRSAYDPRQFSGGLIVLGKFTAAGNPVTSFARLAAAPQAGSTTLALSSGVNNWNAGDKLALPDTRSAFRRRIIENKPDGQSELVSVTRARGSSVTLRVGTVYAHKGSAAAPDLLPHVANLTRNVRIESAQPEDPNMPRAHVLVNGPARVDLDSVAFVDMGRTLPGLPTDWDSADESKRAGNQKGRYALHFHHLDGPFEGSDGNNGRDQYTRFRALVTGCAFDNSFALTASASTKFPGNRTTYPNKWQIALHGTTRVLIKDNVLYGATGSAVATEDGNEGWNEIVGNYALNVQGQLPANSPWKWWTQQATDGIALWRDDPALLGSEGTGFWLSGHADMVWNNVAADCGFSGILIKPLQSQGQNLTFPLTPVSPREDWVSYQFPEFNHFGWGWNDSDVSYATAPSTEDKTAVWQRPMGNNEVYGALEGIETWGRSDTVMVGATVWNCHIGIEPWQSEISAIEGLRLVGDPNPLSFQQQPGDEWGPSIGINNHFHPVGPLWKNLDVTEFGIGMLTHTPDGGIADGRVFDLKVENGTFACPIGIWLGSDLHYKGGSVQPAHTYLVNCRFQTPPVTGGSALAIRGRDSSEDFQPGVTTDMQVRPNIGDEVYVNGLYFGSDTASQGTFRFFFNGQKANVPYPMQSDLASGWKGGTLDSYRMTNTDAWAGSQNDADGPKAWCGSIAPPSAWDNPRLGGVSIFGLLSSQATVPASPAPASDFVAEMWQSGSAMVGQVFQNIDKQKHYKVALFVDDAQVATLDATQYRDEGRGHCGFTWTTPLSLRDGLRHHIRAEIIGEGVRFGEGDYTFR